MIYECPMHPDQIMPAGECVKCDLLWLLSEGEISQNEFEQRRAVLGEDEP